MSSKLCIPTLFNYIILVFILIICAELFEAKLPLIEDFALPPKLSQQTQCAFHQDLYEIGEKWKPNIEPFGVQLCILCECVAIQRKRDSNVRVLAKVQCRNFRKDCPKANCTDPILLPDRCCKSCPGDTNNIEEIIASQKLEEALLVKNLKRKFYAIISSPELVGQNITNKNLPNNSSIAFFHLNKQRLAFIIQVKNSKKPTYLRFQDMDDTIIEEYIVQAHNKSEQPPKDQFLIFGSWLKMPKLYRTMIRKGHLKISLSFSKDINTRSSLSGTVRKHTAASQSLMSNESFYHLLESSQFGKGKAFDEMLSTTTFVSYKDQNSVDRKALMDQSSGYHSQMNSIDSNLKCYYEAQIYEEGAQWKNQNDDCEMCFCQRGRVKCESEICLKLRCKEQIRLPGQCCPICKNRLSSIPNLSSFNSKNQSCYFEGDKKYHLIGSRWHPYIPPFGFDRCTVCTCTENAKIKCKRNECPPLRCAERDAYRENPMDCCKKCRAQTRSFEIGETLNDQADNDDSDNSFKIPQAGSCRFLGRIYANGEEWNPTVDPFGEINCIRCNCKDGRHRCQRLMCKPTPPGCRKIIKKGQCCPVCAGIVL